MELREIVRPWFEHLHIGFVYDNLVGMYFAFWKIVHAWQCRRNYSRTLLRLKQGASDKKTKVLFIVSEPAKWKCQKLYEALDASGRFDAVVALSAWNCQSVLDDDALENHLVKAERFFQGLGDKCIRTVHTHPKKFSDLARLHPDVVIYNEQWNPCKSQHPIVVSRFALTFFIPYYVPVFGNMTIHCLQEVEQLSYVYFTQNKDWSNLFAPYFKPKTSVANLIHIGHPALDYFSNKKTCDSHRTRVIFAPHFAIPNGSHPGEWYITQSTFDWSGKSILTYASTHPEIHWIFKPHPLLRRELLRVGFMTNTEVDEYYDAWRKIGEVCESGDYQELFINSLAMITDSGSFLTEYAATGHPVIHLWCECNTVPIPMPTQRLMDTFYHVTDERELLSTLKLVLEDRQDPKREQRLEEARKAGILDSNASEKIVAYLTKLLRP